jgi:hypothetical protein
MSTRNLPGSKGLPARGADNLTTICEPIVYKWWRIDISQTYGPSRPVTGIALPFHNNNNNNNNNSLLLLMCHVNSSTPITDTAQCTY